MAVTYTATLEPQHHRELITYVDSFGLKSKLYIHASQVGSRESAIQAHLKLAEANEANMTALQAAHNAAQAAPAASSASAAPTASSASAAPTPTAAAKATPQAAIPTTKA